MRFSNKIPKYYQVSVLPLKRLSNPAEQQFLGGMFVLTVLYIGKIVHQLYCIRFSTLFTLWLFRLIFDNRRLCGIGIRSFFRLRFQVPVRSPVLSGVWPPALSGSWSVARCPTSASGRNGLIYLVLIFRDELSLPHSRALSNSTSGAGSSLPVIHVPALGERISASETSSASARHSGTCVLETSATSTLNSRTSSASAGTRSALHHHALTSEALAAWSLTSTLETLAVSPRPSALKIPVKSAGASTLTPLDVLIRTLAIRAIWASWSLEIPAESTSASALSGLDVLVRALTPWAIWTCYPGIIRLRGIRVCVHLWPVGNSRSPSRTAAPSSSVAAATCRLSNRLTGQDRQCQHGNDCCCDFCLFHFLSLSLRFNCSFIS